MASTEVDPPAAPAPRKPSMKERLTALYERYGKLAIGVYLALCVVTFVASFITVKFFGWKPQTVVGEAGVWTLAYLGYKALQPVRILAAAAIVPFIVKVTGWGEKATLPAANEPPEPPSL